MFGSNNNGGYGLADIAAAVRGTNGGDLGGNSGWWILIILFAIFGYGNNGFFGRGNSDGNTGGFGGVNYIPYPYPMGNSGGVANGYVLGSDFSITERKLDGINNGICSLGYDQLAQMNGINSSIASGFNRMDNAVCTLGYQTAQLVNDLKSQLSDCCCQNREAIAQVRYDMATDTCAITNAMQQGFQTVMQNCNNNYRQLHDEMVNARMEAKDETIAMLRQELQFRDNKAVNADQTAYITAAIDAAFNRTHPQPIPSYEVPNPYVQTNYCNCGQRSCC